MESSSSVSAKLFVGRISECLEEVEIRDYFAKFGEVKEVVIVKDRVTGNVRGFGFVEFVDPSSAEKALDEKEHSIGDRRVEVKRARPRGEQRWNYQSPKFQYANLSEYENRGLSNHAANNYCTNENPTKSKKIFVGGLSSSIAEDEFRSYFEKFGKITDVVIMYDNSTHRPRGFGFITYDSVEAVDHATRKRFHELSNKTVEVKVAVPKGSNNQNFCDSNGSMGGGYGPALNNYQRGFYPPYSPRYGLYHGYAPRPAPGFYYGAAGYGSSYVPYGWYGYGSPLVSSRSPVPYGSTPMHPGYFSAGFGVYAGMARGSGYRGCMWSHNDNANQTDTDVRISDPSTETKDVGSEKLEV